MEGKKKRRISSGMRIFIMAASLSLVFVAVFAVVSYIIISGNTSGVSSENMAGVVIQLVAVVIAIGLLLGLGIWYGMDHLLTFMMKRLISDMQQICEGGKLTFAARKQKKEDPIGLLYEYYAKFINTTGELLTDINEISIKRGDGDVDVKLDEMKYKGVYFGAAQNVNNLMGLSDYKNLIRAM